jgi:hypothetical protein
MAGLSDTTGLFAMDYRITDAVMIPKAQASNGTRRARPAGGGFLCFRPAPSSPPAPPPLALAVRLPSGSFNNMAK